MEKYDNGTQSNQHETQQLCCVPSADIFDLKVDFQAAGKPIVFLTENTDNIVLCRFSTVKP